MVRGRRRGRRGEFAEHVGWRGWARRACGTPVAQLLLANVPLTLAISLVAAFFVLPVLWRSVGWQGKTAEGSLFVGTVGAMICLLLCLIIFHVFQLIALW